MRASSECSFHQTVTVFKSSHSVFMQRANLLGDGTTEVSLITHALNVGSVNSRLF